jgi:tetratricopeptide (TPR) repeat protein
MCWVVGVARRVFLSHTLELREFPQGGSFVRAAEEAVSRAGDAIMDMQYFTARDDKPSDYCRAAVRSCDVYIGLIGLRYGSPVRDRPDVSYTELEFDTATEAGLVRLAFLLDENAALPIPLSRLLDQDSDLQSRQQGFRDRLLNAAGITVRRVTDPLELQLAMLQALQETRPPTEAEPAPQSELPTRPGLVGREAEVASLVEAWLPAEPPPVAVLGAPGIGKSAICLAALHHERVQERFGARRWFVRCDGARSAASLLSGVAAELGVIADRAPATLRERIRAELEAGPAVVVLDNFETPWTAEPIPVEQLLGSISAIQGLAVTVSVRGTARPAGLPWRDMAVVGPLPLQAAKRFFLAVAGMGFAADPGLDGLLNELDGVPLAVELLAYAAQGQPDLADVAERWHQERTGMLERMGGGSRELSAAVSIEMSVRSPLMTAGARRMFGMLGMLPEGVARGDLTALLPDAGQAAAAVLRQLGLAFDEDGRLRMLAPIREHAVMAHAPEPTDLNRMVSHYAQFAATVGRQVGKAEGGKAAVRLQAETGNISVMLQQAAMAGRIDELVAAMRGLVEYWRLTGASQPLLLDAATAAIEEKGTSGQQARLWEARGHYALARAEHDTARDYYERALPLYQQAGDVLGQADCMRGLGDTALAHSDYGAAQAQYERALPLYQRAGSLLGQADCTRGVGEAALRSWRNKPAQSKFEEALPLYRRVGDVLGEATCIRCLGEIVLRKSEFNVARARLEEALPLFQRIGDLRGEANCINSFAEIDLAWSNYDSAGAQYERALQMFRRVGSIRGEATCISGLGKVAVARSDPDAALSRYERALSLFRKIGDVRGEANCIEGVADVALKRSDLEVAHSRYEQALSLQREVGNQHGEADCILGLGDIAVAQSDPGSARVLYEQALSTFRAIPEPYSIGWALVRLAQLEDRGATQTRHWNAAREAWLSIGRNDLVESVEAEFK